MTVLLTANLELRICSPSDAADFIDLERDPEVMHYLNGGAVDYENLDPNHVTFLMPRGYEPHVWTARWRTTGGFVGWFCLYPETNEVAEIGYRLRRQDWGKGLASEGAAALVGWGFKVAGYDKVVACTSAANQGSRRVMEKTGMTYTHTAPLGSRDLQHTECGEVWYELTRAQWLRSSQK